MLRQLGARMLPILRLSNQSKSNTEADFREQSPVLRVRDSPNLKSN